jgi:hypothetical protein
LSVPPPGYVPPPDRGEVGEPAVLAPAQRRVPRKLIAAGVGLAAAVAAVLVVFGSSSSQAVDPIAQAATVSSSAPGYRMDMSFTITSAQLGTPISGSGSAIIDPPDRAASMSIAMDVPQAAGALGTSTLQMGMVLDGETVYVKLPQLLVSQVPTLDGKPWIEENLSKAGNVPGLSSVGDDPEWGDPGAVLKELRGGAGGIVDEGQQRVDGVHTTHYHAELDLARLVPNLPSALVKQLTPGEVVPVDVWIDAHNLVRRVVTSLTLNVPNGPSLQETATSDLTDYGPQPRPTPPPADQVTAASAAGLAG